MPPVKQRIVFKRFTIPLTSREIRDGGVNLLPTQEPKEFGGREIKPKRVAKFYRDGGREHVTFSEGYPVPSLPEHFYESIPTETVQLDQIGSVPVGQRTIRIDKISRVVLGSRKESRG